MGAYKNIINSKELKKGTVQLSDEELKKLQKILLQAFIDVFQVCKNNNIKVMMIGGSALGAVRHKGFIPWDDDLDIAMSRTDYSRFKKIFKKYLSEKYILDAPNYSDKPSNRFPKVLIKNTKFIEIENNIDDDWAKIKIDIFIIENVPQSLIGRYWKGCICSLLMFISSNVQFYEDNNQFVKKRMFLTNDGRKLYRIKKYIGFLFSWLNASTWMNLVDKSCQYKYKTKYMGIPTGRGHYFGEICKRDTFFPVSNGTFEGYDVFLPNDVDEYLTNLYGDYMKIPPLEKREKHSIRYIEFCKDNEKNE